ncbi:hypothetical protein DPMN_121373 [Dreissena polymorpha]|uniref:Uncharacterized protein n=1 Tax=Dreissena polymorpha TaxID=45954 RepID=A0A9D4JT21_DREPO|nr:hypothetical protein DPMN_121373 [Dreissena polymorpha]
MGGFGRLYGEVEAEYVAKLVSENQDLIREKSVKSQGILFHQVGGIPDISSIEISEQQWSPLRNASSAAELIAYRYVYLFSVCLA